MWNCCNSRKRERVIAMAEKEELTNRSGSSSTSKSFRCPICLGPFVQESYLDHCFHKFCLNCILRWTKVVSHKLSLPPSFVKCPLCKICLDYKEWLSSNALCQYTLCCIKEDSFKTDNFSIVHGYNGITFQRHYISEEVSNNSSFFTDAHKYRLRCYYIESDDTLTDHFNVLRYWKSCKYLQQNRWLQSWLRREIQAILQEEDVEIIVHHILGVIDSLRSDAAPRVPPEASRENFKALVSKAAAPFLAGRSDRFVNEVELFLSSGLNTEAYDKVYMHCLGPKQNPNEENELVEQETVASHLHFFDGEPDEVG